MGGATISPRQRGGVSFARARTGLAAIARAVTRTRKATLPRLREWVSIDDPNEARRWMFDVTFLSSNWECLYGRGCQGVLTGAAPELQQGCCSYGAHFTDDADVERVTDAAARLDSSTWQFAGEGHERGIMEVDSDGTRSTRLVDDACIFLNRPGFAAGPGCALHLAALADGIPALEVKPDVCWQLPLRREDTDASDGTVLSTVTQWERKHWGDGGAEFHWWCTEAPEAFGGASAVYQSMREELRAMAGDEVLAALAAYLDGKSQR